MFLHGTVCCTTLALSLIDHLIIAVESCEPCNRQVFILEQCVKDLANCHNSMNWAQNIIVSRHFSTNDNFHGMLSSSSIPAVISPSSQSNLPVRRATDYADLKGGSHGVQRAITKSHGREIAEMYGSYNFPPSGEGFSTKI